MSLYSGLSNNRPKQQSENNRNKGVQDRYIQVKTETHKGRSPSVENLGDFSQGFTLRSIIIKTVCSNWHKSQTNIRTTPQAGYSTCTPASL